MRQLEISWRSGSATDEAGGPPNWGRTRGEIGETGSRGQLRRFGERVLIFVGSTVVVAGFVTRAVTGAVSVGSAEESMPEGPPAGGELRDHQSAAGLQHPVHLPYGLGPIGAGDMVQHEGAGQGVELGVAEREILSTCHLELDSVSAPSGAGAADHLLARVDAHHRPVRPHPLGDDSGQPSRTAADVKDPVTLSQFEVVGQTAKQPDPPPAQERRAQVVEPGPADELVAVV